MIRHTSRHRRRSRRTSGGSAMGQWRPHHWSAFLPRRAAHCDRDLIRVAEAANARGPKGNTILRSWASGKPKRQDVVIVGTGAHAKGEGA